MAFFRRCLLIAGIALAQLLTGTLPGWPGRGGEAAAQMAQPKSAPGAAAQSGVATPAGQAEAGPTASKSGAPPKALPELPPAGATGATGASDSATLAGFEGHYDIRELKRLIDLAKESGFSEKQLHEITVEDENGRAINAYDFLQAYERRKKELAAREAAERNKVYLTPKDILRELDDKQRKDLDKLRDTLIFND